MDYVTQGTVQVEFSGTTIDVMINPVQEFTVRYRDKDYTVFMADEPNEEGPKAFEKAHKFKAPKNLERPLIDAASKSIAVEIKIDSSKAPKIVSVKIPATLRSGTV
jgi:hypothetical protein